MSEIGGIGTSRHFTPDEEEALRRDESTNAVLQRDAKTQVAIHGHDRSWRETKHEQQEHVGVAGWLERGTTAFEAAEIAQALPHSAVLEAIGVVLPAVGLGVGVYELGEAHHNASQQARALEKEFGHAAVVSTLDLPVSYKQKRLDGDFAAVPKEFRSRLEQATAALTQDPKGRAVLQLHADRGMNAARDLQRSGMSPEAFLKGNPRVAEQYREDAAFHEGFDAYLHVKANGSAAERKALDAKLEERDGWYAQSHVQYRV
jgi:hypothetical protein